ncbi:MAG TPA: sugar-binding domain-containing protein [Vitreimonas sp.]|nr:sugar-binding domain-containing protein [Vitreimonas sp.]
MSDVETLVRVSRLYYELGETQGRIADLVGVTRPQVSKLLKEARAEGIVEIRIHDRATVESPAADELRHRFGLRSIHLAPALAGPEDLTRRSVGRLAAQIVRAAVRDGDVVGCGDGASISALADALPEATTRVAATIVPLCGGYWLAGPAREPFRRLADALGAQAFGLLAPGLVDDAATKDALVRHAGIRAVLELWERLDVAVFGIGGRGWSDGALGPDVVTVLEAGGAVGEVLIAPFNLEGRFLARDLLGGRTIAFDPSQLSRVAVTIGVAAGSSKVEPLLGALRAGVLNTVVTDAETAEAVVQLDDATREPPMPEVHA